MRAAAHDSTDGSIVVAVDEQRVVVTSSVPFTELGYTGDLSDDGTISFSLDTWSSAVSFFNLGIEHIQFGPDHLLFLLVLTLAAVGTTITPGTAWRTVKLVTAFTVGHAVSLGIDVAQTLVVLLVISVLWLCSRVLAERTVWVRLAAASGAAVFGIAWTASRLVELSA